MSSAKVKDKKTVAEIIKILKKEYPWVKGTALNFTNPLELLIATILSAQCTDVRVNEVTKKLFKKYRTAEDYANSDIKEIEQVIKPVGFYRRKARFIKETSRILVKDYNSRVPISMKELLKLPGIARKTANVVLSNAYEIVEGIAVDTHVKRLSRRLGLTKNSKRDKIEQDLMKVVPRNSWFSFSNLLIVHGRNVCKAKKTLCVKCVLNKLCPSAFGLSKK